MYGFGQLVFVMPQTFVSFTETQNDKTKWMNLLLEKVESPGSQRTAVILVPRGVTLLVYGFGPLVFVMPQTFVSFAETRNDKTKWMDLLLEKVESPGSQRTAVILVSHGVTLLVCGVDQLVFVRPQTFVPFTETRKDETKWMDLLLEKVESPRSQRTAIVLSSRGVTLLVCGVDQLVFVRPQTFVPFTETRKDETKWMDLLLEKVESPRSQRTAIVLSSRGVTLPDTLVRHVLDHLPIYTPPFIPNCFFSQPEVRVPPRATFASLQKSVSEILGKLEGLEEVVATVRESVEEVQTQANTSHENHVGMCQQLQRSVDDIMQRDPGSDGGGVSRAQRSDAKDENMAWRNDAIRWFWILTAERPAMYNLKRSELQAVLAEVTAVTDRVTNQLNTLTGFAVTDYMAEGDDMSAAGDMFLREQMDVMVQSLLMIIGTSVESDTGAERMQTLARAFHEGAGTLRVHCRKHRSKLRISANKNIMRDLVNEDVKSWAADLFGAAVAALKASRSPPTDFPDVVVPAWTKPDGYITTGGLQHAPNVAVSGLKVGGVKRAAPAGAAGSRGPCWSWSKPDGCSFGKACVHSHSPAKKYRAGDGGSGSCSNSGGGSGGSISRGGGSGSGGGTSSGGSSAHAGAGTRSGVCFSSTSTAACGSG